MFAAGDDTWRRMYVDRAVMIQAHQSPVMSDYDICLHYGMVESMLLR